MGKKGFGQSKTPTRAAKDFMRAFMACCEKTQGDPTQIHQFFKANQSKLNESLLDALPAVFSALLLNKSSKEREHVARIFSTFGNLVYQFPLGSRMLNLELSITSYKLVLQVYTREAFPEEWAGIQNNLGNAYRDRIHGERAENLEQAIENYKLALQVYTYEAFPEKWARSQGNLAEALRKQASLTGNYADLETATILLLEALEVLPHGSPEFIESHYILGNVLSLRYEQSHNPSDLEQALQAYKIALDLISPEHYDRKQIWQALPATQSILGSRLVRDGQWQEGLQLLLNSLRQLSTEDNPLAHANALFQTGRAYEVMADLDNARLYYRDALRLYEHLKDPLGITQSRAGLGSVLASAGHMEKGFTLLGQALEGYRELLRPDKVAEVEKIYQMVKQALEQQKAEAYV